MNIPLNSKYKLSFPAAKKIKPWAEGQESSHSDILRVWSMSVVHFGSSCVLKRMIL